MNPPWQWNARERVVIESMEDYLQRSGVFSSVNGGAGWREPLRVKHVCDKMCNEEGSKFL